MVLDDEPDWLPSDWIAVRDSSGRKVKYYRNTETGQTFYSKEDVVRYINMGNVSRSPPQSDGENKEGVEDVAEDNGDVEDVVEDNEDIEEDNEDVEEDNEDVEEDNEDAELPSDTNPTSILVKSIKIPEWLPRGWTVELRTRDNGVQYKCFIHPQSGRRFYSKQQVSRFLETVLSSSATQKSPGVDCQTGEKFPSEPDASQQDGIPDWLPDGWVMELKIRGSGKSEGKRYKCYIDPESGCKFFSKPQVFDYLKTVDSRSARQKKRADQLTGDKSSSDAGASEDCKSVDIERSISKQKKGGINRHSMKKLKITDRDSAGELPAGWILETRTRKSGKKDPFYIDPLGVYEFRSKLDALRYIKTGDIETCALRPRLRHINDTVPIMEDKNDTEPINEDKNDTESINEDKNDTESINEDIVVIERGSVEGLPPGWIRELRTKKSTNGKRRDPYFIDPLSGYEFRSKPDALRYLRTGDIKRCAIKPKRREINGSASINEDISPVSPVDGQESMQDPIRRQLFPGKGSVDAGGLASPKAESSKEKKDHSVSGEAIVASGKPANGSATEKCSRTEGSSDPAAKALFAENGRVSTPSTDILQEANLWENGTVENNSQKIQTRSNKSKNKAAEPLLPGRSSKRLKGVEPETKVDPLFNERAIRSAVRGASKQLEAEPESETNKGKKHAEDQVVYEEPPSQRGSANKPNGEMTEGKESELLFPFGDSTGLDLDPCLEFAVKTLTGAIPVEDNLVIQGVSNNRTLSLEAGMQ